MPYIKTGLVSPQFHVRFDDFFESTRWDGFMPRSEWKYKSHIVEEKASNTLDLDRNTITKLLCPNPINNCVVMSAIVGDVVHLHQALKQPDREEFVKAMVQEISTHQKRKHWKLVPIKEVPENIKILDSVWAMRQKRKIGNREISKYKARLNAHGGQKEFGINYWETYAPIVMWTTIRLIITLAKVNGWYSRQLAVYIDDCILIAKNKKLITAAIKELPVNFEITDEGEVDEYSGVKVETLKDKRVKMSQPFLIDQILSGLGFNERTKTKKTPAVTSKILHLDKGGDEMQTTWEYRRIIGQLNFFEKSTHPDIAYAVHQCTRFSSDPKHHTKWQF